jgi:PTH1 family peptidyl-tRNA hydrolase
MESILRSLTTDGVPRLRLGIDTPEASSTSDDLAEFVLSPFDPDELTTVGEMCAIAADACEFWLANGIEETMNRFNG